MRTARSRRRRLSRSPRFRTLPAPGKLGRPTQRLLFASTGTKDPRASDTLYIGALAAPNTINTIPEETLAHFADHGEVGGVLPRDGARAGETLSAIVKAGVDLGALAGVPQKRWAWPAATRPRRGRDLPAAGSRVLARVCDAVRRCGLCHWRSRCRSGTPAGAGRRGSRSACRRGASDARR